jgi:hypothetical protein
MCKDLKHLIYYRFNTGPVGKVWLSFILPRPSLRSSLELSTVVHLFYSTSSFFCHDAPCFDTVLAYCEYVNFGL